MKAVFVCAGCVIGAIGLILLSLGVVLPSMTYSQYESTIMGLLSTNTDMSSDAYKEWMKGNTGVSSTRSILFPQLAPANNPSTHQRNLSFDPAHAPPRAVFVPPRAPAQRAADDRIG